MNTKTKTYDQFREEYPTLPPWDELKERLVKLVGNKRGINKLEMFQGDTNVIGILPHVVLKCFLPGTHGIYGLDREKREITVLKYLQKHTPDLIPRFYGWVTLSKEPQILCMIIERLKEENFIPFNQLDREKIGQDKYQLVKKAILQGLKKSLEDLYTIPWTPQELQELKKYLGEPLDVNSYLKRSFVNFKNWVHARKLEKIPIGQAMEKFTNLVEAAIKETIEVAMQLFQWMEREKGKKGNHNWVLLHGDLHEGNIFLRRTLVDEIVLTGRLPSDSRQELKLIDWEYATLGEPALDIAMFEQTSTVFAREEIKKLGEELQISGKEYEKYQLVAAWINASYYLQLMVKEANHQEKWRKYLELYHRYLSVVKRKLK